MHPICALFDRPTHLRARGDCSSQPVVRGDGTGAYRAYVAGPLHWNLHRAIRVVLPTNIFMEDFDMGLGKGALLWFIGIPIPIILALMFFLR